MPYDLYPAVNEDYEFAPAVRAANAKTAEFRNQVIPMTQTARNNLSGPELWDGRLVMNTTTSRIDRYELSSTSWQPVTTEPAGVIKAWGGPTAPAYHALLDGSVQDRTGLFSALFAVYGTTYNTGGEAGDKFRLPNGKGRMLIGVDPAQAEFNVLGETGGSKTHTLTTGEMPSHGHSTSVGTESANHAHATSITDGAGGHNHSVNNPTENTAHNHAVTVDANGGGAAHNNLPPYLAVNYIVTL